MPTSVPGACPPAQARTRSAGLAIIVKRPFGGAVADSWSTERPARRQGCAPLYGRIAGVRSRKKDKTFGKLCGSGLRVCESAHERRSQPDAYSDPGSPKNTSRPLSGVSGRSSFELNSSARKLLQAKALVIPLSVW